MITIIIQLPATASFFLFGPRQTGKSTVVDTNFWEIETFRRLSYARSEASLFYWRTSNGAEVDLIIEKHGQMVAVFEIKSSQRIDGADCSGLKAFAEEYPQIPGYIISTARNIFDINQIRVLPWREFFDMLEQWM